MKQILFVLGIVIIAVKVNAAVASTTYYVSPYGSDNNNGASLSTPVKTISNALRKAQNTGDIVYVTTGNYVETVSIKQSGITLTAYPGNKPVIDGGNTLPNANWGQMIVVHGNYNTISNFEVRNSNSNGVHLGGVGIQVLGHHNRISSMNVHHSWSNGISINGDYNIAEDNSVWQNSLVNSIAPHVKWGSGMSALRNRSPEALIKGITSYATFRRNKVFNNWGEGLSCLEVDHCVLEDNIIYDNWTINLYLSDATNSLVQRNIIYVSSTPVIPTRNNLHSPVLLADELSSVFRSTNNKIINNCIYNTDLSLFGWTNVPNSGLKNVLISNNTIVDGWLSIGAGSGIVNSGSKIMNNIILGRNSRVPNNNGITFSNNNWLVTPSAAKSSTDVVADPQIARIGPTTAGKLTADFFKLLENSPVIDAGLKLPEVKEDYFMSPRTGSDSDIGAHEFGIIGLNSTVSEKGLETNLAQLASVTASSQNTGTNQQATKVIDGIVKSWPDNTHEWATNEQKVGAWIELKWDVPYTINKVVLYDRPNIYDQITSALLTFSNGSTIKVGSLTNSGGAVIIDFQPVLTNSIKLTVDTVGSSTVNIGLDEFEVFGF